MKPTIIKKVKMEKHEIVPMKEQVKDILVEVSWGRISTDYFGKGRSWLSKKMNGKGFNGGSGDFSSDEKETLKNALKDLSKRISDVANKIK